MDTGSESPGSPPGRASSTVAPIGLCPPLPLLPTPPPALPLPPPALLVLVLLLRVLWSASSKLACRLTVLLLTQLEQLRSLGTGLSGGRCSGMSSVVVVVRVERVRRFSTGSSVTVCRRSGRSGAMSMGSVSAIRRSHVMTGAIVVGRVRVATMWYAIAPRSNWGLLVRGAHQ